MSNDKYALTQTGEKYQNRPILLDLLAGSLIMTAVVFGLDMFAVETSVGRFHIFEFVAALFASVAVVRMPRAELSNLSIGIIIAVTALGVSGFTSIVFHVGNGTLSQGGSAIIDSVRYAYFSVVLFFLTPLLATRDRWRRYYQFLTLAYLIVIAISVAQILAVVGTPGFEDVFMWGNIRGNNDRIAGTLRWQGPFVLFLAMTIPLVTARIFTSDDRWGAVLNTLLVSIGLVSILFSGSRTALLVLPFALIPAVAGGLSMYKRTTIGAVLAGGGVFASLLIVGVGPVDRLFLRMVEVVLHPSQEPRFQIWLTALSTMTDISLLFGLGPQQTSLFAGLAPHNSYVGVIAERGLIGAVPMVVALVLLLKIAVLLTIRAIRDNSLILLSVATMVPVFFVYNMTASGLSYRMMPIFIAFVLATFEISQRNGQAAST
jgi:O-antigen ligase